MTVIPIQSPSGLQRGKQADTIPAALRPTLLRLEGVSLSLGGQQILENINLEIGRGEFVCVVGPSGCGKTTMLRLLAGLYQPTIGRVTYDGSPIVRPRRDVAIVFQDYANALLPWRTASGNIALALEATVRCVVWRRCPAHARSR